MMGTAELFSVIFSEAARLDTEHMWAGPYLRPPTALAARTVLPWYIRVYARCENEASRFELERRVRERVHPAFSVEFWPWHERPLT